jgi:hypothetical protein
MPGDQMKSTNCFIGIFVAAIALAITMGIVWGGASASVSLNWQTLSDEKGFAHDPDGALVIHAYYPDYKQLPGTRTVLDPAVSLRNWYGEGHETFKNVSISVATNESGEQWLYDYNASVGVVSGFETKLVLKGLADHKREVTSITISYPSNSSSDQITDTWNIPPDLLASPLLDYNHALKRMPETDKVGDMIYRAYNADNRGEITYFTILLV